MRASFISLLVTFSLVGQLLAGLGESPQWIVVTAPEFRKSLDPLCSQRKADGFRVVVLQTTEYLTAKQISAGDSEPLRKQLHQLCKKSKGPSYILLVGAYQANEVAEAAKIVVPPLVGVQGRMKGNATDLGYAIADRDGVPAVAVGRFPARSEKEARLMVEKTLAFERNPPPGLWRNRITLLVGNPGGDSALEKQFAEGFVQNIAKSRFQGLNPLWTVRILIHASSPFGVPDDKLREMSLRYLKEDQLIVAFLGHSGPEGFWSGGTPFVDRSDWSREKIRGVFFTCGCFGCQVQGRGGEGYGLAAMRNPAGPSAIIGASGESFAAFGQLALDGLLERLRRPDPPDRLADYWLGIQAGLAKGKMDALTFWLYDQVDGSKGKVPLSQQRKEHLEMWLLLGDPALRLPLIPRDIVLKTTGQARPGKTITIEGLLPDRLAGAKIRLTLERPAGSLPPGLQPAIKDVDKLANHAKANDVVLQSQEIEVRGKRFQCKVQLPAMLPWPRVTIRAHAADASEEGMGLRTVAVKE
jgi:hypothetical protein